MAQEKLVDRWKQDIGVAFYDEDGSEVDVTDEAKKRRLAQEKEDRTDEIEEV